ncbi:hypothetical protein LWI28_011213 [Acer negundo]|uniref:phosphoribosyl-ATP diphosphatase n=1 Tax=Acer negundo TaxID=4023 RepID=A0AAD5IUC0_ACENE|nr:hypothetical protein LWI28_011213 [Acer negundo]
MQVESEDAHALNYQRGRNDPYSNTYNPGLPNHQNFSYSDPNTALNSHQLTFPNQGTDQGGEDAYEFCRTREENEDKSRTTSEMAYVLYHAIVLLTLKNVKAEEVHDNCSLPFVTNQTKSQPQEWPLRLHKTIGCQLRGIVTILAPPPGNSLRSVVVVAVIVALSQALLRNSWSWRAKKRRLR